MIGGNNHKRRELHTKTKRARLEANVTASLMSFIMYKNRSILIKRNRHNDVCQKRTTTKRKGKEIGRLRKLLVNSTRMIAERRPSHISMMVHLISFPLSLWRRKKKRQKEKERRNRIFIFSSSTSRVCVYNKYTDLSEKHTDTQEHRKDENCIVTSIGWVLYFSSPTRIMLIMIVLEIACRRRQAWPTNWREWRNPNVFSLRSCSLMLNHNRYWRCSSTHLYTTHQCSQRWTESFFPSLSTEWWSWHWDQRCIGVFASFRRLLRMACGASWSCEPRQVSDYDWYRLNNARARCSPWKTELDLNAQDVLWSARPERRERSNWPMNSQARSKYFRMFCEGMSRVGIRRYSHLHSQNNGRSGVELITCVIPFWFKRSRFWASETLPRRNPKTITVCYHPACLFSLIIKLVLRWFHVDLVTHVARVDSVIVCWREGLVAQMSSIATAAEKKRGYVPTKMWGRISVMTKFSLSTDCGVLGTSWSSMSRWASAGHSIKCGYSVFTASKPPTSDGEKGQCDISAVINAISSGLPWMIWTILFDFWAACTTRLIGDDWLFSFARTSEDWS